MLIKTLYEQKIIDDDAMRGKNRGKIEIKKGI